MEKDFTLKMSQRTDEELTKIVTTLRNDYQPEAVLVAEQELRNRKVWNDELTIKVDEKINEGIPKVILSDKDKWKQARYGVITFCAIHFIFEILTGNQKLAVFPVFVNYMVSAWYIKDQISLRKESKNLFTMGLAVSCVVFLIRLVLGIGLVYLMSK
jgi:hypothetical protein